MRLVLEIGYHKMVLPEGTDATAILNAFSGVQLVRSRGYGSEEIFVLDGEETISLHVIKSSQVREKEEEELEKPENEDVAQEKTRAEGE